MGFCRNKNNNVPYIEIGKYRVEVKVFCSKEKDAI